MSEFERESSLPVIVVLRMDLGQLALSVRISNYVQQFASEEMHLIVENYQQALSCYIEEGTLSKLALFFSYL